MKIRLADQHRVGEAFRRHGAIVVFAAVVLSAFVALAAIGAHDRRADAARAQRQAIASETNTARTILDRQQAILEQMAVLGATASDATARQFLDQVTTLAPGIRGAALTDASGAVQLRAVPRPAETGLDETELAVLGAEAAKEAAAYPAAGLLITQTLRDGDNGIELLALARAWLGADGRLGGVAFVALDRAAFAGLDLVRADGSPLFGNADPRGQLVALGDLPLMLRAAPRAPSGAWLSVAVGAAGAAGLLALLAVLTARLIAANKRAARQAAVERELRETLAEIAAKADQTDELNRTKSQFFAQVTHELRTPLNAILGFSETIRQEIFGPVVNARYLEYAGLIHDAGSHLLSLINDLLDEARIESGRMEIAPIRVSAPALARSALDLVELLAGGRNIALTTTGLSSCPDLNIDPRAMKQVLVNLLSNAIKYTPPGGHIDLRFASRDDGSIAIEVEDTGIGMSAEDLRVAFEPFGRASAIEARRQQGTGLGLSLARALTRLHGGDLTLASRLDAGTVATVILPAGAVFGRAGEKVAPTAKAA